MTFAVYETTVRHTRHETTAHRFAYRYVMWHLDIDELPTLSRGLRFLAEFRASDHFGKSTGSIRTNVERFLKAHGIDAPTSIMLLTTPRSLGYAFNPLSVFWCYRDGALACTIAEVSNTFGERHCYLLVPPTPDTIQAYDGHSSPDPTPIFDLQKEFFVSPFFDVSGQYTMRFREPSERLDLAITLMRQGHPALVATVTGRKLPVRSPLAAARRSLGASWRTTALIHLEALKLRARRVPYLRRPPHHQELV